jgi:hypothetical protein
MLKAFVYPDSRKMAPDGKPDVRKERNKAGNI